MPDPVCARCGFAVTRWQHAASCKVEEKNPLVARSVTINPPTVTDIPSVTVINVTAKEPVTPTNKSVRGRPAKDSSLTPAQRAKAYRERKATIPVEASESVLRRLD